MISRAARYLRASLATFLLLVASPPAPAWNGAGHRLSAAIAWRTMTPATRNAVSHLLAAHPDHTRWASRTRETDKEYGTFLEASTWADDIKHDRRFHNDGQPATRLLPGFPDMGRHRHWHYADHRLDNGKRTGNGELDIRLQQLMRTLGNRRASLSARSYALAWVVHLVADAHQPLHAVSRYDKDGDSDEGGNGLWVETPRHPRLRGMSLHAYWDDLPGPPWLRGEKLEASVTALLHAAHQELRVGSTSGGVSRWIGESRELARTLAYANLGSNSPVISDDYDELAVSAAKTRIVLAGRRLAQVLETALSGTHVSRGTRR